MAINNFKRTDFKSLVSIHDKFQEIRGTNHKFYLDLFILVTALFTNMRTLKFKSRLRNCVFCYRQS